MPNEDFDRIVMAEIEGHIPCGVIELTERQKFKKLLKKSKQSGEQALNDFWDYYKCIPLKKYNEYQNFNTITPDNIDILRKMNDDGELGE